MALQYLRDRMPTYPVMDAINVGTPKLRKIAYTITIMGWRYLFVFEINS